MVSFSFIIITLLGFSLLFRNFNHIYWPIFLILFCFIIFLQLIWYFKCIQFYLWTIYWVHLLNTKTLLPLGFSVFFRRDRFLNLAISFNLLCQRHHLRWNRIWIILNSIIHRLSLHLHSSWLTFIIWNHTKRFIHISFIEVLIIMIWVSIKHFYIDVITIIFI